MYLKMQPLVAHAPVDGSFPYQIDCSNWTQWVIKTKRNNENMKLGEGGYIGGLWEELGGNENGYDHIPLEI